MRLALENWDRTNFEQVCDVAETICATKDRVHALIKKMCPSEEECHESFQQMEREFKEEDLIGSIFCNTKEKEIIAFCIMPQPFYILLSQTLRSTGTIEIVTEDQEKRKLMFKWWVKHSWIIDFEKSPQKQFVFLI